MNEDKTINDTFKEGTGAGIYALLNSNVINSYFLIFISVLCFFSIGTFILLIVYLDRKIKP